MKLISKLTTAFTRWRQRLDDIQHQDGYKWAYSAFYNGGWSLEEVEIQSHPFGGGPRNAFERGILVAVSEIQSEQAARRTVLNQAGEPVGVPFMIEFNPGQPHKVHRWTEEEPYYVDPDLEAIETLRRRREQGKPIIRLTGGD